MHRLTVSLVALTLLAGLGTAAAHPVARLHHDRSIQLRLSGTAINVEYTLALDGWTLVRDLAPFSKEIGSPDDAQALYAAYARIYGPRLAQGLAAQLQGKELRFDYLSYQLKIEDHLRYTFQMKSVVPGSVARSGVALTLSVTDSNFALEPGNFSIALCGDEGIDIKESNVAADLEKAPVTALQEVEPQQEEKLRTAVITFFIHANEGRPSVTTVEAPRADVPRDGLWEVASSLDAHRLLAHDLGLAVLLILAFFFGAAHALQPGHGKTLVAAYLVGEKGTVLHAFLLGLVTTFTHTFVVILLAIVLPLVFPEAEAGVAFALTLGSGLIVVLLAIWLLLKRLGGQADHVHLFGGHHHYSPANEKVTWTALVALGVTGGIVPCVDALGLLAATVVLNKLWLGLPLILAFSAGLASVLVAVGVLVVKFRRFATSRWGEGRIVKSLPIVSAVAMLLLGLWMCQQALRQRDRLEPSRTTHAVESMEVPHAGR
jgi:ABC-type nickel/cobalt efflux system permease component RcnA